MTGTSMRQQLQRGWQRVRSSAAAIRQRYRGWLAARRALRELDLGRHPDGSTLVLDYRTGQLVAKRGKVRPGPLGPVVPFEYADLAWLERVIAMAGYRVRLDDDGDLEVRTEAGRLWVRRGGEEAIVRFFVRVAEELESFSDNRFELVNVFNLHSTHGRWVLSDDGVLFMSCDLYAGAGVTAAQILSALRAVSHEVGVVAAHLGLDQNAA